jgi:hypothetical protein
MAKKLIAALLLGAAGSFTITCLLFAALIAAGGGL